MQSKNLRELYLWPSSGAATVEGLQEEVDQHMCYKLLLKQPGNKTREYVLCATAGKNALSASEKIPLKITKEIRPIGYNSVKNELVELRIHIQAEEDAFFNFQGRLVLKDVQYDASQLYLPGFWYRKNLRSPDNTPSERISKNWIVREDRLSTPLSGIFDQDKKISYSLIRIDKIVDHALAQHQHGEVILSGHSGLGGVGFGEQQGEQKQAYLSFAYPYQEAPHSYFRKLTLGAPVTSFLHLKKGENITLHYQVAKGKADHYKEYIKQIWTHSFDLFQPQPLDCNKLSDQEIKHVLAKFYTQSFVEVGNLKGFSGIDLQTQVCESKKTLEVGFIGRVLLNAFNALEWAEETHDKKLEEIARAVLDSYEQYGFADNGFIRELVDQENDIQEGLYTIRRQSEGIYAVLLYLNYEKKRGRKHTLWEQKILRLLDILLALQQADGSFPRKFRAKTLVDVVGGSSPAAVLPLAMVYRYFGDSKYLHAARKVIDYQEKEIISQSDYFSSTLDADCEDKEASLYAAVALYYMALVTQGAEKERYVTLAQQAAYFALSWYYTWDVPFAKGQMLGDLGLKSRGWGNVSVENNHIDVYVFEFDEVLTWLTEETGEPRFAQFAEVIRSSMREQLLPYEGHMVGISKEGYYPEVVQHTHWDYGHYGKGFYNLYFAPGWTVTSIWELLTDNRAKDFMTSE